MPNEVVNVPADEFETFIERKKIDGWELKHLTDTSAEMTHWGDVGNIWVHAAIFLFTFWWTFGILNMLYLMLARIGGSCALTVNKV